MSECIVCHRDDVPLFRTAPLGVAPARWKCKECLGPNDPKPHPDVERITSVIDADNNEHD